MKYSDEKLSKKTINIGAHRSVRVTVKYSCRVSSAQQLWDKWELQCMVLASFTLQAFFLFAAGIRRRSKSTVLRVLLWLAYLSADYVAVFVLGHLTRKMDDQLVLLWAPVLLLHLGGQDTITAFSMEDNELWKRHLLGLLTQVAMAVYVVAKSWRSSNLVAPVALMFVSGTVKYGERTWALKTASSDTIKDSRMSDLYKEWWWRVFRSDFYAEKWWPKEEYADLVQAAGESFHNCMNALMDIPVTRRLRPGVQSWTEEIQRFRLTAINAAGGREEVDTFPSRAYKLVEIQLSLMYDHLYTKVGLRYAAQAVGLGLPLLTLATPSSALALFAAARKKHSSAVDVAVSYVLLAGAVALEVLAILAVMGSFRSYYFLRNKLGARGRWLTAAVFWLVRSLRPYDQPLWSNKWGQNNLLAGCIKEKQAGVFTRAMRRVDFSTSVVTWHLVTDMCFFLGREPDSRRHMALAREVSSYLMDLVMERRVLSSSEGHVKHLKAREEVKQILAQHEGARVDTADADAMRKMLEAGVRRISSNTSMQFRMNVRPVLPNAWRLAQLLVQQDGDVETGGDGGGAPWKMITSVWIEMLFHLATRCDAGFHAKNLSTGGEFITHVRLLLHNRGIGWNFIGD
ncbi:hypothetical protein EJB05_29675, partial [Eragrostis curvula]